MNKNELDQLILKYTEIHEHDHIAITRLQHMLREVITGDADRVIATMQKTIKEKEDD